MEHKELFQPIGVDCVTASKLSSLGMNSPVPNNDAETFLELKPAPIYFEKYTSFYSHGRAMDILNAITHHFSTSTIPGSTTYLEVDFNQCKKHKVYTVLLYGLSSLISRSREWRGCAMDHTAEYNSSSESTGHMAMNVWWNFSAVVAV